MKSGIFISLLLCISLYVSGQQYTFDTVSTQPVKSATPGRYDFDLGFGIGLDYGGIGAKFAYYPIPYVGPFANIGFEMVGLGWNVGCIGRLYSKRVARPYIKVMYGVNGFSKVEGTTEYNKIFKGLSTGIGLELRWGRFKNNGMNIDLNIPFHGPDYYSQIDLMKHDPRLTDVSDPAPVTFSIGYHVVF